MSKINKRTEEEIKILQTFNGTMKELSLLLNRNYSTIQKWCKEFNIKLQREKYIRKYNLNEYFFKTWSNEMAYVLGFIAADGCIHINKNNNNKRLQISLSIKDIKLLENIKEILQCENPIKIYKRKDGGQECRFAIRSITLCNDLINLGIVPRKYFILEFPDIPEVYISHYIRGYFDGDGCISITKTKYNRPKVCVSMSGNFNFLSQIKEKYNSIFNNKYGSIRKDRNIFNLNFGGTHNIIQLYL